MIDRFKKLWDDKKIYILNVIIVVAAICLVITIGQTIEEIHWIASYSDVSEDSFMYALEDEDYGYMVEMYYRNCGISGKEDKKLKEYYGVAKYYEAAFLYRVYLEEGATEQAKGQKDAMDAAVVQMGDFAFVKAKIDAKLGLAE